MGLIEAHNAESTRYCDAKKQMEDTPLKNSTTCRPKGSPLCTILRYPFLVTDPKNFLKAPLAPLFTNFEWGARAKKTGFWSKFSKNCLKTPFLACFFKILPAKQKIWSKWGLFSDLGELRKSIWST